LDSKMSGSDVHDLSYYQKCMMGGILSCGITHTLVCPLDIVKCRMQVSDSTFGFTDMFLSCFRPCQACTRVSEMDSDPSTPLKE